METHEDFEEDLDAFFKRHIDNRFTLTCLATPRKISSDIYSNCRWLESKSCLERLLSLWTSTVEYFIEFIPNSNDINNKRAAKTEVYKKIALLLCDSEVLKTKIKV